MRITKPDTAQSERALVRLIDTLILDSRLYPKSQQDRLVQCCLLSRSAHTPQQYIIPTTDELSARMVGLDDERHQDVYFGQDEVVYRLSC